MDILWYGGIFSLDVGPFYSYLFCLFCNILAYCCSSQENVHYKALVFPHLFWFIPQLKIMSNLYEYRHVPSSKFTNTLVELVHSKVDLKVSPTKWVNVKDAQAPKEHLLTSQVVLRRWGKWRCVIQRKEDCEGWRRDTKIASLYYVPATSWTCEVCSMFFVSWWSEVRILKNRFSVSALMHRHCEDTGQSLQVSVDTKYVKRRSCHLNTLSLFSGKIFWSLWNKSLYWEIQCIAP